MKYLFTLLLPITAYSQIKIAIIDTGFNQSLIKEHVTLCHAGHYDYTTKTPVIGFSHVHGSIVSSILARNLKGLPYCLIQYQVSDSSNDLRISSFNIADAIIKATNSGAQFINLSLAGPQSSLVESQAIKYAISKGVTIFAAAGNDGHNIARPNCNVYPACYIGVIAVEARDDKNLICRVSNFSSNLTSANGIFTYKGVTECATSYATPRYAASYIRQYYSLHSRQVFMLRQKMQHGKPFINMKVGTK